MMKVAEFIAKLKEIEAKKTVYALGMFGMPITSSSIDSKTKQLTGWYTEKKKAELKRLIGKGYFGFDCVCLIKAVLWGWNGNLNDTYGGAKYNSNGVPDCGSENILNYCSNVSTDFSKIEAGEVVWMPGHVGVYIGNGQVIECSPKWENAVQYTSLGNIPKYKLGNYRVWTKHGKMPWIDYAKASTSTSSGTSTYTVKKGDSYWAIALNLLGNGSRYKEIQELNNNKALYPGDVIKIPNSSSKISSTKMVSEIAKEVIAGKWGSGEDRKKKLEAAGYNYSEVQKKVNELMK